MPLRDLRRFDDWVEQGDPHPAAVRVVGDWIAECGDRPWLAPSAPIEELSDRPNYELRQAVIPDSGGILVVYWHVYDGGWVDLVFVGSDV